jgi:hypothetical protein
MGPLQTIRKATTTRSCGDTSSGRQHLPAVSPGAIDAGGTTGGYQGGVEFSRVRIRACQRGACPLGINLKQRIGLAL